MNLILELAVFFLVTYGLFRLFGVEITGMRKEIAGIFARQEYTLKRKILIAKGKKKENKFIRLINDTKKLLILTNRYEKFEIICFSAVAGSVGGVVFSFAIGNPYLAIPLSVSILVAPFIYVKFSTGRLEKKISEELETALSIITNSYIRSENIILAVEENINYINEPVKGIFQSFLNECNYINPDIKSNLATLRGRLSDPVFVEYCNALIQCQNDITLKSTLYGIVKKLSNIRIVTARLDGLIYAPVKEFFMMVTIYLVNLPAFYLLNKEWYRIVTDTTTGHIMVAASAGIIVFAALNVLRLTRPITYRR